jgi:predicted nucleic acid-binding protein
MSGYVLDTSAILTKLYDEEGSQVVTSVIEAAKEKKTIVYLPFMSLMEVKYRLARRYPSKVESLLSIILAWPLKEEHSSRQWCDKAAELKAPGQLSVADAWIASLAFLQDAELIHKDPEFDKILHLKAVRLPDKK